jgi:hypothetical protein
VIRMKKSKGTISSRDKNFFVETDRPRIEIIFWEQDERQSSLPRRNRFVMMEAGWVWIHNEDASSAMTSNVHTEFSEALALLIGRSLAQETGIREKRISADIEVFDVGELEISQLLENLALIGGLADLYLHGEKVVNKELQRSSANSRWGVRFIRTDESPRASNDYEIVLSNCWSALSGGPMVFDGWEYVVREVGTKHYFLLNEGDQTSFVDSAYYLGKCKSKKEAITRMVDYSTLWEMDENGKLVDVSVFEE